jgi:O-Antigen ligase
MLPQYCSLISSIFIDAAIIFAIAVWVFRCSWKSRLIFTTALPILLFTLFANQRRASFLTLIIALILVAVVIFRERRVAFYLIVPALSIIMIAYIAAFWNSTAPAGMPARAIRSVVDPTGGNARDHSSNLYRLFENINSMATIKSAPLTGVGFGNKFLIVVSMADISHFVWWQYITHNSIMWIWMKTGLGGISTLFFLIGYSLMQGTRITWHMPSDEMGAIALTATLAILMHFMYAYVDISWVVQSMIFVGGAMGVLGVIEKVVVTGSPPSPLRWPWQSLRPKEPGLRLL